MYSVVIALNVLKLANGFVTIGKDTAVIDLIANADGVFQYSLDGQEFEQFDAIPHQNCE